MSQASPNGMIALPGGVFQMGSDEHYPEEAPAHPVAVDPFWIDETPVTNAQFARFVAATGHVTLAQIPPDPKLYPGMDPAFAHPASAVFVRPDRRVDPRAGGGEWWRLILDARWNQPFGEGSSIAGIEDHPVIHVSHDDAAAYAAWAGKSLPTEAEWEFAARGGLEAAAYAWGEELAPGGAMLANYWQGAFPSENLLTDGFERTSPVRTFPANGYGLYDMIGNVWEWTSDWWADRHEGSPTRPCCAPRNPRGPASGGSHDPAQPGPVIPRRVLKGGSHLCAENYCRRYRPAARHPQPIDTTTSHIGFRCVVRKG
jgi:sulfatase modifying factor 1